MEHFVYIIYSERLDLFYKGYSSDPFHRLDEHNLGLSRYTKNKGPWKLVFIQKYSSKRDALVREKQLKRYNHEYIQKLIRQDINLLNH